MTKAKSRGRIMRGVAAASLCGLAVLVACTMDGPTAPAPFEDEPQADAALEPESTSPAAMNRLYQVRDRLGRLAALLRAELEGGREAGTATFEVLLPARSGTDAANVSAETRAVITQIVEAQARASVRTDGERKVTRSSAEAREFRAKAVLAAREALRDVQIEMGTIEEVGRAQLDTLVELIAAPEKRDRAPRIRIREMNPFGGGQQPLFFIDGAPATQADLDALVPQRIESIEVIKGEAARRLHGEEAAYGVIQIYTKGR